MNDAHHRYITLLRAAISGALLSWFAGSPAAAVPMDSIDSLPDPTLPSAERSPATISPVEHPLHRIKLQSIIHSGQRKSAVINGYIKTIGSSVDGGKIIDIRHDAVVISRNGRHYTLPLNPSTGVTQLENQP